MHVIVVAVHRDKLCGKVAANVGKHPAQVVEHVFRKHFAPVFSDKDQVGMKCKKAVSAATIIGVIGHRPMLSWALVGSKAMALGCAKRPRGRTGATAESGTWRPQ